MEDTYSKQEIAVQCERKFVGLGIQRKHPGAQPGAMGRWVRRAVRDAFLRK